MAIGANTTVPQLLWQGFTWLIKTTLFGVIAGSILVIIVATIASGFFMLIAVLDTITNFVIGFC